MPSVSHGEIDPRGPEPALTSLDRFWDDALRRFSEQFRRDDGSPSCPMPQEVNEDARSSLNVGE
jgi:hypothetical protein